MFTWSALLKGAPSTHAPAAHHVQGGADVRALVLDGALQILHAPALLPQVPLTLLQLQRQSCVVALHPPQVLLQPAALLPQGDDMLLQLLNFLALPGPLQQERNLDACCGAGSQLIRHPTPRLCGQTQQPLMQLGALQLVDGAQTRLQLLVFLRLPR